MTTIVNKTVSCHIIIEEAEEEDAASEGGTDIVEDEEEDKEEPPPFPALTRLTSIQPLRQGSSSRSADASGNGGGHTVWRWWIDGAQGNAGIASLCHIHCRTRFSQVSSYIIELRKKNMCVMQLYNT